MRHPHARSRTGTRFPAAPAPAASGPDRRRRRRRAGRGRARRLRLDERLDRHVRHGHRRGLVVGRRGRHRRLVTAAEAIAANADVHDTSDALTWDTSDETAITRGGAAASAADGDGGQDRTRRVPVLRGKRVPVRERAWGCLIVSLRGPGQSVAGGAHHLLERAVPARGRQVGVQGGHPPVEVRHRDGRPAPRPAGHALAPHARAGGAPGPRAGHRLTRPTEDTMRHPHARSRTGTRFPRSTGTRRVRS